MSFQKVDVRQFQRVVLSVGQEHQFPAESFQRTILRPLLFVVVLLDMSQAYSQQPQLAKVVIQSSQGL